MKHALVLLSLLTGCSHAYVQAWNDKELIACCPNNKIFCKKSSLDDLAQQQCNGPARAIAGGTKDSGTSVNYYQGQFGGNAQVSTTRDMCIKYQCE